MPTAPRPLGRGCGRAGRESGRARGDRWTCPCGRGRGGECGRERRRRRQSRGGVRLHLRRLLRSRRGGRSRTVVERRREEREGGSRTEGLRARLRDGTDVVPVPRARPRHPPAAHPVPVRSRTVRRRPRRIGEAPSRRVGLSHPLLGSDGKHDGRGRDADRTRPAGVGRSDRRRGRAGGALGRERSEGAEGGPRSDRRHGRTVTKRRGQKVLSAAPLRNSPPPSDPEAGQRRGRR
mmetsp:Transcript_21206/g.61698  ORF Transcript_21206/g.61698 Transcript_21206/m.61698 type:complete len:235 (+) Transcript_21206:761-1465(+)